MRILALLAAVVALVIGLAIAAPLAERLDIDNRYARERNLIELEKRRDQLERSRQWQTLTLPASVALQYSAYGLLIAFGVLVLRYTNEGRGRKVRDHELISVAGLPVPRRVLEAGDPELLDLMADALRADKVRAIEEARRPGPVAHSYSPRISISGGTVAADALAALPSPVAAVPAFSALLSEGKIGLDADGRRQPLILAYNAATGEPIEGSWKDLYSAGVGALQGAGKSWLEAFLLGQSAAQGARLIICDPHAGHDSESLAARIAPLSSAFLCDVAQSDREILDALKLANDELVRRAAGKGESYPLIVCVDEWTSLLRGELGAVLPDYVTNFAEQGRKFNVNALLSAQGWTKDAAGIVRNRLTSHYVLRQRPDEARYQLGLRAAQLPTDIRTLPDATGYLLTVRGNFVKVVIPRMTAADLVAIGEQLGGKAASEPPETGRHFGFAPSPPKAKINRNESDRESGVNRDGMPSAAPADLARVIALFRAGKSIGEIVREIYGALSGTPYNQARAEVERMIRQALAEAR